MHIKTLQLKNFRRFEDATFEFGPGFNLLVGENGSGKSSVLAAIYQTLNEYGNVFGEVTIRDLYPLNTDVRITAGKIKGVWRFNPIFPANVDASYFNDGKNIDVNLLRDINSVKTTTKTI